MNTLLKSLCVGVSILLSSCSEQSSEQKLYNRGINIIPAPASLTQNDGTFKLTKNTKIYTAEPNLKVAEFFAAKLKASTGYSIEVSSQEARNGILLLLDPNLATGNDEGYTLDVTPPGITIKAKTQQGLFYGMQTLMQLLPAEIESSKVVDDVEWNIPAVSIKDEPRFKYRGMLLDPCRHFISVENIKKQLDVLALFKINRVHWHLTDDQAWRIEIKKYPKLTEVGSTRTEKDGTVINGYYTQEEIKEVVKYAADRFITIVPEIEMPGHELAAICAYPELSCTGEQVASPRLLWGVEDIVLCAGKEETFRFLEDVIAEVVPLFPGEYFHIGGDECPKIYWENCPLCQKRIKEEGLKGDRNHSPEARLQSYFIQRMEKVLEKYGKKIIGWDEILEGGLAESATVMSWRGEQGGIAAANMNHNVIMTPGSNGMYIDQYQGDPKIEPVSIGGYDPIERVYAYDPVPDSLVKAQKENFVLGVQCNVWAEYLYTNELREYRTYPRILALSEIAWTPVGRKDYKDFERRLDNALVRLDKHNINYYIPQPEQPNGSCNFVAFTDSVNMEFKTTRPVKMVYTTDGSEPDDNSTVYTQPIPFKESATLKIRSVLPSGKMSNVRTITIEKQTFAPAKQVDVKPGLTLKKAKGELLRTSELANVTDWKESVLKELSELTDAVPYGGSLNHFTPYSAIAQGYLLIPEDDVYFFSSDNEEVWVDGKLLVDNGGEVKRYSRKDKSVALAKGLHEFKVIFLSNEIGGWPSIWNDGHVSMRKADEKEFMPIDANSLFH